MTTEQERKLWEFLKTNTRGLFALSVEERNTLFEAHQLEQLEKRAVGGWVPATFSRELGNDNIIYRIDPAAPYPEPERWWFRPTSGIVLCQKGEPFIDGIEVTPEYAQYLNAKPDGECELRKVKTGDVNWVTYSKEWVTSDRDYDDNGPHDRGYRWCRKPAKPEPTGRMVEYDITVTPHSKCYNCDDKCAFLHELIDFPGFAGIRFELPSGELTAVMPTMVYKAITGKPCPPRKAVFWEGE